MGKGLKFTAFSSQHFQVSNRVRERKIFPAVGHLIGLSGPSGFVCMIVSVCVCLCAAYLCVVVWVGAWCLCVYFVCVVVCVCVWTVSSLQLAQLNFHWA